MQNNNQKLFCNLCKSENEAYENYHVDHNITSFKTLRDDFLKDNKTIPDSFEMKDKHSICWSVKDEDNDFKNNWIKYHNQNCDFQILCKKCNLTKG